MVGAAIHLPDDAGHNRVCARRVEVGAVRPDGRRCSFGNEQKARMSASAPTRMMAASGKRSASCFTTGRGRNGPLRRQVAREPVNRTPWVTPSCNHAP